MPPHISSRFRFHPCNACFVRGRMHRRLHRCYHCIPSIPATRFTAQLMLPRHPTSKPVCTMIAAMLVIAMLCAQWVGMAHRISHADKVGAMNLLAGDSSANAEENLAADSSGTAAVALPAFEPQTGSSEEAHSCALIDAASLGAGIHSRPFQLLPMPGVQVLALWAAFASWQSPFACHFSSRAPPRF